MRLPRFLLASLLLSALTTFGQSAPSATPAAGFSVANIDKAADPCTDFYQYACGNWLKNTQIPADQSEWVSFVELEERNKVTLRDILEKASANDPKRSPLEQKIGDYYASCMDEKAADAAGLAPLQPELKRVAAARH